MSALGFGGILPEVRAVTHGLLALGLIRVLLLPGRALVGAGVVRDLVVGLGLLLAVVAASLLPAPRGLLRLVAPGVAAARPSEGWWTFSLAPEDTVGEVTYWGMLLGMATLAAVWGAARYRRSEVERGGVGLGLGLALMAAAHHFTGESALFGAFPTGLAANGFFAPFVDRNHIGAALALCMPLAAGMVLRERRFTGWWSAAVTLLGLGTVLIVRAGARGAALGLLVCGVIVLWRQRGAARWMAGGMLGAGGLGLVLGSFSSSEGFSAGSRLTMWARGLQAWGDAWLMGTGGGTLHLAIAPYRTDFEPVIWTFLHSDPLEWLVETGIVGLGAAGVAAWFLVPRAARDADRALWPTLGLLALGVNAAVEFPLQMPALALGFITLLALRRAVFEERRVVDARLVRGCVLLALLLQLFGAAWMTRQAVADRASAAALRWSQDPDAAYAAADRLRWTAPWRGERALVAAWEALADEELERAADLAREIRVSHPERAFLLRAAAQVLWRAGAPDEAFEALDRAELRAPADWRTSLVRARMEASRGDPMAWSRAFTRGVPARFVEEAFHSLPLGVYWVEALDGAPTHQLRLAELLLRSGDLSAAVLAFEAGGARGEVHPGHVRALFELGRLDEAEQRGRAALERTGDPRHAEPLADVLAARGRHGEALDLLLLAAPERPRIWGRALHLAFTQGGLPEAERLARRMELLGTPDPEMWLTLAELRLEAGDRQGCLAELRRHRLAEVARTAGRARALERRCAAE